MKTDEIARICHAANRELQIIQKDSKVSLPWHSAPDWQRDSAKAGVLAAIVGDKTPEQLHLEWCEYKLKDGWVLGHEKNSELKTHPCLVPYSQLPPEQKIKDDLFLAIVNALS